MSSNFDVQPTRTDVFWGEIAPCEHMAQFYENDDVAGYASRIHWWRPQSGR